jgi:S1-C subfamily serine protease
LARRKKAASASFCPRCNARVTVALGPDEVCPECDTAAAWQRHAGQPIRIDQAAIDEALARRAIRRMPVSTRALPCIGAFLLGLAALVALRSLLRDRRIAPLEELAASVTEAARWALWVGAAATLGGVASAVLLLRSRLFRVWPLTGLAVLAIGCGLTAAVPGALSLAAEIGWRHLSMPALEGGAAVLPGARRIMAATTAIVAPDADGDASRPAIGTGAIVRSEAERAWIVTCSHVAMPYAAVASFRSADDALPVWVYFSDGRNREGTVVWTAQPPLDVALVAVDIDHPPAAIEISFTADTLRDGTPVMFVPNPLRSGWKLHAGLVSGRRAHLTQAGRFSLVFTDLPLQPGDSGSGLFDSGGRLIGLNTWRLGDEERTWLGISLPSDTMKRIANLVERGEPALPERPR